MIVKVTRWKEPPDFSGEKPKSGKGPIYRGNYKTIGTYSEDSTASQLFGSIALGYLTERLSSRADEIEDQISNLAKKLS